jgi:hypothetical protein
LDKAFKLYERKGECLQQLAKTGTQNEKEKRLEEAVEAFRYSFLFKLLKKRSLALPDKCKTIPKEGQL